MTYGWEEGEVNTDLWYDLIDAYGLPERIQYYAPGHVETLTSGFGSASRFRSLNLGGFVTVKFERFAGGNRFLGFFLGDFLNGELLGEGSVLSPNWLRALPKELLL
jgi:hypothetical protein